MRPHSTRNYIRFTIDDELPQHTPWGRARPACGAQCKRCLRFTGFCLVCTGTLFQAVAPWVLSVIEAVGMLLMCLLLVPHPPGPRPVNFDFRYDLEDLAVGSAVRAVVISGTYAYGTHRQFLRPYLYTAYAAGGAGIIYTLAKAFLFSYSYSAWLAQAAVIAVFGSFSWVHVLAARNAVVWARKRTALGLATYPWEPGLQEGLLARRRGGRSTPGTQGDSDDEGEGGGGGPHRGDVPPELLADPDSNFTPVGELWVHWKEALPAVLAPPLQRRLQRQQAGSNQQQQEGGANQQQQNRQEEEEEDPEVTAVLLIHSGGGGTFAWRNVMTDLSTRCGVRVVAFDRPGFGLTSRPQPQPAGSSRPDPYAPVTQALLVLQLCGALGIKRVLLVAHGDGCLVAIMAAAMVLKSQGRPLPSPSITASCSSQVPISIPGTLRPDDSADLVLPSSVGSSEVDSSMPPGRSGFLQADPQRRRQQAVEPRARDSAAPGEAGGAATAGAGAGVAAGQGNVARKDSEQASLAGSLSFQSLIEKGGSGTMGEQGDLQQQQQFQQQQVQVQQRQEVTQAAATTRQQHGRAPSRLSQQSPGPGVPQAHGGSPFQLPASYTEAGGSHQGAVGSYKEADCSYQGAGAGALDPAAAAAAAAAAGVPAAMDAAAATPPDLQAMTPKRGGDSWSVFGGLAPQLWPRATPQQGQEPAGQQQRAEAKQQQGVVQERSVSEFVLVSEGSEVPFDLEVMGVALLHPRLSGQTVSGFTRLLARAKLGRTMLRPLLRSELGEVANRRAWHRHDRCTRQVLDLYRRPLRVEGWDTALLAASTSADTVSRRAVSRALAALRRLPLPPLVATGAHDKISSPVNAGRLAGSVGGRVGVVAACGHLSHEEAPEGLLDLLCPFVDEVLSGEAAAAAAAAGTAKATGGSSTAAGAAADAGGSAAVEPAAGGRVQAPVV